MEYIVTREPETASSATEQLREERQERGAEHLTPERERELTEQAEGIRREIVVVKEQQRREAEERTRAEQGDLESVQRLTAFGGNTAELAQKLHEEIQDLANLQERQTGRELARLQEELDAVMAELGSGATHGMETMRSREESVLETSLELAPDLRQETSATDARLTNAEEMQSRVETVEPSQDLDQKKSA